MVEPINESSLTASDDTDPGSVSAERFPLHSVTEFDSHVFWRNPADVASTLHADSSRFVELGCTNPAAVASELVTDTVASTVFGFVELRVRRLYELVFVFR